LPGSASSPSAVSITTGRLCALVEGTLRGSGEVVITGVNTLQDAKPGDCTFIIDSAYAKDWASSKASAVIVTSGLEASPDSPDSRPLIVVANAERALNKLLDVFQPPFTLPKVGVDAAAVVHPSVKLGKEVRIGPQVWVDRDCVIGDDVTLFPGVCLYAGAKVGAGTVIHSNTVIRERCEIGRNVILHQNVSVGADGFNFRPDAAGTRLVKVPHIGNVIIEDDVEIGSNSCVDRGKFGATIIGAGTKIDNLCQIAHNCRIGRGCLLAGQAGMGGSTVLGDGVQMGGKAGIIDHINVGSGVKIGAAAIVFRDIPAGETWHGYPAAPSKATLRQWAAIRRLADQKQQRPA